MIRCKVTLKQKGNHIPIFDMVYMSLPGDTTNLRDLQKALNYIKQDCNGEANRKGLKLSECDMLVTDFK